MPATARSLPVSAGAAPSPLVGLCIEARIAGALSEFRVEQSFRNDEDAPIEAVYSFPLPADAVLLDIAVEIGGRFLRGDVVALPEARQTYEEALADGDGACLLEQVQPGIFTLNAGNLRPGETARIVFAFASLNRWSGDRLRLAMPTTIAPRYGRWPVAPHAEPAIRLSAENRFSLRVALGADLRAAAFACPSHRLRDVTPGDDRILELADGTAAMDRDIVLEIRHRDRRPGFALLGQGPDGIVALASFQPLVPGGDAGSPIDAVAVIDCSGSMAGTSIDQARKAMRAMLSGLDRRDLLGVIAFGSTCRRLEGGRHAATRVGLAKLGAFAEALEADLGGTEIDVALDAAIAMAKSRGGRADIFLVTDGQVADWTATVARLRDAGLRVFAVGVGHGAAEPFLSALATATGGAVEFVTPDEAMAGRIARHFERMRAPRATQIAVAWPDGATALAPATPQAIFDGDTIHAFGLLPDAAATGDTALTFMAADGTRHRQTIALAGAVAAGADGLPATVARLAAAARLATLPDAAATALAVSHRLLGPGTAWVVAEIRDAAGKTDGMPALRPVPQMLAAAWGGTGATAAYRFDEMAALSETNMAFAPAAMAPRQRELFQADAAAADPRTGRDGAPYRIATAIRQALAGGRPAPGRIALAAGRADELEALRRAAASPFLSDLICAAFEFAILDSLADGDDQIQALRAELAQRLNRGITRLHEAGAMLDALHTDLDTILPSAADDLARLRHRIADAIAAIARAGDAGREGRAPTGSRHS